MIDLFKERWASVSGEYIKTDADDFPKTLTAFLQEEKINRLVVSEAIHNDELNAHFVAVSIHPEIITADTRNSADHCAKADAGLTTVDALIADTGSLVIASRVRGDRLISSLPPIHIVNALSAPIFHSIGDFMETIDPSFSYTLITGPSRTADIEKKLVLGAHGPLRVVVFGD